MRRASTLEARRADPRHTYAGHALHAEWTKARTAGGTAWLLLAAIVATVAVGGVVAAATRCPAVGCGQDPAKASFTGIELGLLYLFPVIAATVSNPHWQRHLEQIAPLSAGLAIQATTGLRGMPISPWAGLAVLAAWAAGAMLAGGLLLRLRDA